MTGVQTCALPIYARLVRLGKKVIIVTADIYDGDLLEPGMALKGPAVIEMRGTTVLVHPNNEVHMDRFGNIHIHLGASA